MALFLRNESTGKRDCGTVRDEIEGERSNFEFGDAAAVHEWGYSQPGYQQEFVTQFRLKLVEKGTTFNLLKLRELTRIMEDSVKWTCKNEGVSNRDNLNEKENPTVPGLIFLFWKCGS